MTQDLRVVLEFFGSCHRRPSFGRFLSMEGKKILLGDLVFKYVLLCKTKPTKQKRSTLLSTTSWSLNLCICKAKAGVNLYFFKDKNDAS